jgi:hypothetical protein
LILNANITDASAISAADGAIDITTTGGTAPYAYQWSTGVTTPDLTDLTAGAYLITVTDINDCSISTTFVVDVTSGVSDIDENQLVVYPNPSADFIQIESTEDQINQVKLYDIMGKLVFEQSINDTKYTMNVSQLSTGLYQLKLSFATGEISRRIEVRK